MSNFVDCQFSMNITVVGTVALHSMNEKQNLVQVAVVVAAALAAWQLPMNARRRSKLNRGFRQRNSDTLRCVATT